jgi:hypothetical protein
MRPIDPAIAALLAEERSEPTEPVEERIDLPPDVITEVYGGISLLADVPLENPVCTRLELILEDISTERRTRHTLDETLLMYGLPGEAMETLRKRDLSCDELPCLSG